MKVNVTYIDGTTESFSNVENSEEGDNFLDLSDEDENTIFSVSLNQIRKIEYD